MATISTHNGSAVARGHNLRQENIVSKEKHINPEGESEVWIDEVPREAYKRIFGEALEKYNARQVRADRKINDYYNHVKNDAKKNCVYEMIAGVYPADGEKITDEQCKSILYDFVLGWRERNPNLELIGAYYHADEQGRAPHVHLDYIPVAGGYKKGLEYQAGLDRALQQQGFSAVSKNLTPQILWEKRENEALEALCNLQGIEVEHLQRGQGVEHLTTELFKVNQELDKAHQELNDVRVQSQQKHTELKKASETLSKARDAKLKVKADIFIEKRKKGLERDLERLNGRILAVSEAQEEIKKPIVGNMVKIPYDDLVNLKATALRVEQCEKHIEEAQNILNLRNTIIAKAKDEAAKIIDDARRESVSAKMENYKEIIQLRKQLSKIEAVKEKFPDVATVLNNAFLLLDKDKEKRNYKQRDK